MRIVPSSNIGGLGPIEGSAVVYDWKWHYGAPILGLWILLVLAIVLVKANRNPRALLILVPLLILNLMWLVFKKVVGLPSSQAEMFNMIFYSLTAGLTILWLLAHKLTNSNRFVTFLLALVIMAVVSVTGAFSYGTLDFSGQSIAVIMLLAVMELTMILGIVSAAWCCRKRYSNLRFTVLLAVCTVIVCITIMLAFYSIFFIIQRVSISISNFLSQVSIVSLLLGGVLYAIMLPYMILASYSPLFRERFYACLRLKSMPIAIIAESDAEQLDRQSQNTGTSDSDSA